MLLLLSRPFSEGEISVGGRGNLYGYDADEFYDPDKIPDATQSSSDESSDDDSAKQPTEEKSGGLAETAKGLATGLGVAAALKAASGWLNGDDDDINATDLIDVDDVNTSVGQSLAREGSKKLIEESSQRIAAAYIPSGSETAA